MGTKSDWDRDWKQHGKGAPEGSRWVCGACGKTSRDVYGNKPYSRGWDESCAMNAQLLPDERLMFAADGHHVLQVRPV